MRMLPTTEAATPPQVTPLATDWALVARRTEPARGESGPTIWRRSSGSETTVPLASTTWSTEVCMAEYPPKVPKVTWAMPEVARGRNWL